mgnify:CR=1 FL=1
MNSTMTLGAHLRRLRAARGLSQAEAADSIGISQTSLSGYERGTAQMPFTVAVLLADFYGVSVDDLAEVV